MYYYWKNGRVRPSVFYSMPKGELTVVQAFYEKELEENAQLYKEAQSKGAVYNIALN